MSDWGFILTSPPTDYLIFEENKPVMDFLTFYLKIRAQTLGSSM